MEYRRLGRSDIEVSNICLGSMTWGEQNSEAEGFQQMDFAVDQGINFIDTAEMYTAPPRRETCGRSEEIIGNWLAARGGRDRLVLATKIAGPSDGLDYIRGGRTRLNRHHIAEALEGSLRRLKTDYVDLYQLHWPDRPIKAFGQLGHEHSEGEETPPEETLEALAELVQAGKARSIGLSNETPWGVMRFLALAEVGRGPRMVSVQNPYSLLNRSFEARLAEVALREDCGLLAYAPVAAGALTGKYLNGQRPEGARMTLFPNNKRYFGAQGQAATAAYVDLAHEQGLDPARMALAYVLTRPFLTSAIIGATNLAQLENSIAAKDLILSQEVLNAIESIHEVYTYPCP
jgi:aryl-alcohol dehydrogenase-like predicted oxidoreductase